MKNISVSGHHISITKSMEQAVMDKLRKVERHFDQIQSIKVTLALDNHHSETSHSGYHNHKAEAIMRVSGQEMFVSVSHDDMYQAINEMAEKLDRQVRKYRTKAEKKNRKNKRERLDLFTSKEEVEIMMEDELMEMPLAV